jgi:formamidopyrimidine-DNA glycosylase
MQNALIGKRITHVDVLRPKCLNMSLDQFSDAIKNAQITNVTYRGKWILVVLSKGWLCINLGMGGEILLCDRKTLPAKHCIIIDFSDSTCLAINFWWFGYAHFSADDPLKSHPMISKLGPNILDVTLDEFETQVKSLRKQLKTVLLDQKIFAGIGNAYIHDILFFAKLHPIRLCNSLSPSEIKELFAAIHKGLEPSLKKSGAFYEKDLYGKPGGFTLDQIIIGYREGKPCPVCQSAVIKIKTGSTSSFICPNCQK